MEGPVAGFSEHDDVVELSRSPDTLVFRAVRRADHAPVVLKAVAPTSTDPRARSRLQAELDLLRSLTMAGIPRADRLVATPFGPALELADAGGATLDRHDGPAPLEVVLDVGVQLATILVALHGQDVVHRDLCPQNVALGAGGRVTLLDFGHAAPLGRLGEAAASLGGTPGYWAPEQTGRYVAATDRRTDLYGLGGVLYRLLTGIAPATFSDMLGAVHAALAVDPRRPDLVRPEVPTVVADLVVRLLAKSPEDRYQSAYGVAHDLRLCQAAWRDTGTVAPFELGAEDVSEVFVRSRALYGRDAELATLLAALDGPTGRAVVVGPAGVGKSALVSEAALRLEGGGRTLVVGKFDQARARPLGAILELLGAATHVRLAQPEAELSAVRARLRAALREAGPGVVGLVPGLPALVGELPPVAELPPTEARNRVAAALGAALVAIDDPTAPLLFFVDDLQWADPASGEVLERFAGMPDRAPLVLAWRDGEVATDAPIAAALGRLAEGGAPIVLTPLGEEPLVCLVRDTLRASPERAQRLAALLLARSGGNPFFAVQLLESLHERGLIRFDGRARRWAWNDAEVASLQIADNVAELLAERLGALERPTQRLLSLGAQLGSRVRLTTLAIAAALSVAEAGAALAPAVSAGHVIEAPSAEGDGAELTFAHDRVQQASLDLLDGSERERERVPVARRLVAAGDQVELYVCADRCVEAGPALDADADRAAFAAVLRRAAEAARLAGAPDAALRYAAAGAALLGDAGDAALRDAIDLEGARAQVLCPDHAGRDFLAELLARPRSAEDRAAIMALKVERHLARWENVEALDTSIAALAELGVHLPRHPSVLHVAAAMASTTWRLWRVGDEGIRALPVSTSVRDHHVQTLLLRPVTAAYYTSQNLMSLLIFRTLDESVEHGLTSVSGHAFATLGFVQSWVMGRPERGVFFTEVAREFAARFGATSPAAWRVELTGVGFVDSARDRAAETGARYAAVARGAYAAGDWESAVIAANNLVLYQLPAAVPLDELLTAAEGVLELARRIAQPRWVLVARHYAQAVASLRSSELGNGDVTGRHSDFDVALAEAERVDDGALRAQLHALRVFVRTHLGEFERAAESAELCDPAMAFVPGAGQQVIQHGHGGVARAWVARTPGPRRAALLKAARRSRKALAEWARRSPHNHGHLLRLLDATLDVAAGRPDAAVAGFEEAAAGALAADNLANAALAMHLAGCTERERGRTRAADAYLHEAAVLYGRWGASAAHDRLAQHDRPARTTVSGGARDGAELSPTHLALLRSARAVSHETSLERLLERILSAIGELVGARRGVLALRAGGELRVMASADTGEHGLVVEVAHPESVPGADAAMAYVLRSGQTLLVADARSESRLGRVQGNVARSILAVPLRKAEETIGVVYVDNELLPGAFRPGHEELVQVLAAQAAVAIENAQLVQNLQAAAESERRLAASFGRFVPRQFLDQLGKTSILEVAPGDQVSGEFTVMFVDVRGFTTIAERLKEVKTFAFINRYLAYVQPCIEQNGGFINQYLGDGIMAIFPTSDAALSGAVALFEGVRQYNRERGDLPEIRVGGGLNTGPLVLGTLGVGGRLDCAVVGDAVNLAARVEGMSKQYGAPLVVSESTVRSLKRSQSFNLRPLDLVVPVGRKQPIRIYEVLDAEGDELRAMKLASRGAYERALDAYAAGRFEEALSGFSACVAQCPGDRAARMMAQRAAELRDEGAPAGWDGAHRLSTK